MNPRLSTRKKVQIVVIFTIMVWATQTLLHQWGYGAEAPPLAPTPGGAQSAPPERFVPGAGGPSGSATLEIRAEATVYGPEVKLRQVCRWADRDAAAFTPVADLVLVKVPAAVPFRSVSLDEIRQTLHDAGVNLAVIRFAGPMSCTVARSDVKFDEQQALQQWIDARQGKPSPAAQTRPAAPPAHGASALAANDVAPPADEEPAHARSLRDLLTEDLAIRLAIPSEQLQINFNPADERALVLAEPQFKFNIQPRRIFGLGDVSWDVLVVSDGGEKKVTLSATARAWQTQVLATRPLAHRQVIRPQDLIERRTLVDMRPNEPLLTSAQAVGQQAAREFKPGTLLTARMVEPVPLAKAGQFITVTLNQGTVSVKTVARAMEGGSYGQTIKAKNEATNDLYEVTLTGPQEATMGPARAAAAPVASTD